MFASLKNLVGLGLANNKGIRRAERPRTRLELEVLDQRLVPSSVPNLTGQTLSFSHTQTITNLLSSLTIQSEQDQGNGTGTFVGIYKDGRDGVSTPVTGSMTFKGVAIDPANPLVISYDFGLTFSGSAEHLRTNTRTGNWTDTIDRVNSSGDLYVTRVSGNPSDYTNLGGGPLVQFDYFGNLADSHEVCTNVGDNIWTEYDPVWASNGGFIG